MLLEIKLILGSIAFGWVLVNWTTLLIDKINKPNLIRFVCTKCYSFWSCLILGMIYLGTFDILLASLSGLGAMIFEEIKKKLEL